MIVVTFEHVVYMFCMLCRYRKAAVPGIKAGESHSRPRGTTDFFADSDLLSSQPQLQSLLNEWQVLSWFMRCTLVY